MTHCNSSVEKLQDELNEAALRHSRETYFLQLELDTTKRAKEATEDRMAELYRELQELNYASEGNNAIGNHYATAQIGKYERMLRIMNNQIHLLRTSSDTLVKSLKDEMSDLMEEKVQAELLLMNKLAQLEREKVCLEQQLAARSTCEHEKNEDSDGCIEVSLNDGVLEKLQSENAKLKKTLESMASQEQVDGLCQRLTTLQMENQDLKTQLEVKDEQIEKTNKTCESREQQQRFPSEETLYRIEQAQSRAHESIDRLAQQWKGIDQTVHEVGRLTKVLNDRKKEATDDNSPTEMLSVLEKLGLVHAQAKASLMWTELNLKNQLAQLEGSQDACEAPKPMSPDSKMFNELLASVEKVEVKVTASVAMLREQATVEYNEIKDKYEAKMKELQRMKDRQAGIEAEMALLKRQTATESAETITDTTGTEKVELFISKKALESLQSEVMQIVEQLQTRNATIGRMKSEIEEHRIRERTLMDELTMYRKDQANVQQREQERLMRSFAKFDDSENCEDNEEDNSEYEERTVEDTYCEETVYEEMTVA